MHNLATGSIIFQLYKRLESYLHSVRSLLERFYESIGSSDALGLVSSFLTSKPKTFGQSSTYE